MLETVGHDHVQLSWHMLHTEQCLGYIPSFCFCPSPRNNVYIAACEPLGGVMFLPWWSLKLIDGRTFRTGGFRFPRGKDLIGRRKAE